MRRRRFCAISSSPGAERGLASRPPSRVAASEGLKGSGAAREPRPPALTRRSARADRRIRKACDQGEVSLRARIEIADVPDAALVDRALRGVPLDGRADRRGTVDAGCLAAVAVVPDHAAAVARGPRTPPPAPARGAAGARPP